MVVVSGVFVVVSGVFVVVSGASVVVSGAAVVPGSTYGTSFKPLPAEIGAILERDHSACLNIFFVVLDGELDISQIVIDHVSVFGIRGNEGVLAGLYVLADLVHSGVVAAVAVCTGIFTRGKCLP